MCVCLYAKIKSELIYTSVYGDIKKNHIKTLIKKFGFRKKCRESKG